MSAMRPALIAASVAFVTASPATPSWSCTQVRPPLPLATGAVWYSINCTSGPYPTWGNFGPVVVNVIVADLSTANLQLLPLAALPTPGANGTNETLAALDVIASQHNGTVPALLGGINGGYFWRLDITPVWVDDVCLGKTRKDAERSANATCANCGVGDAVSVSQGVLVSHNCDCHGFSRPAVLTINGTSSHIDILHRGDPAPAGVALDSIGAGPNLVSTNASGPFVNIPSDDDNIGNILEHSANTGVGLRTGPPPPGWAASSCGIALGGGAGAGSAQTAMLVTVDGYDGCPLLNSTCGTNAFLLAALFKDCLGVGEAMGMDQGGSTTMWLAAVQAADPKSRGIVSNTSGRSHAGVRQVFNGLYLRQWPAA